MPFVHIIPVLRDNYSYVVEGDDKRCIIIDPGQVGPIDAFLRENELIPVMIINTHHHADHVAGNLELKSHYGIPVLAPARELALIPRADKGMKEGDVIEEAGLRFNVIETPGHTKGHIALYEPDLKALFAADTVFSMGCGRLMEGSAEEMFSSLQKLKTLPLDTLIYAGHEYTADNGRFALSVEPENQEIKIRMAEVTKLRGNNLPTYPVTLETELKTNPFLRAVDTKKFAELRLRKDSF